MKKLLKTFNLLLLCVVILFSSNVFAAGKTEKNLTNKKTEQNLTHEKFEQLKKDGIIGDDIKYDYLLKITEEAKQLEKKLEKDSNAKSTEDSKQLEKDPNTTQNTVDSKQSDKDSNTTKNIVKSSSSVSLQAGDIIITNSTASSGILGHAAIALEPDEIFHIGGAGETVASLKPSEFKERYKKGWIKVYRINNSNAAQQAANWACLKYKGTSPTYKITYDLTSTNPTYCSKIVWQAYHFGVKNGCPGDESAFIQPYALPGLISQGSYKATYIGDL